MRLMIAALLLFRTVPAFSQWMIDTVAGGYIPNGVPALTVELVSTIGITGDREGNIYFVGSHYLIREISKDGTIKTIAGNGLSTIAGDGGPALAASLGGSTKLTADSAGNLFFIDTSRIRRIDASSGTVTTVAGTGIPGSLGADGPATLAQIDNPSDITLGRDGVYFSEPKDNRIRKLTADGHIALVAEGLNGPSALAADAAGNIYVAEVNQDIRRITVDGAVSVLATGFSSIRSLAAGAQGELYVGDCLRSPISCQIRSVGPDGTVHTVAGSPTGPLTDGPAASVTLGAVNGLFADGAGTIYFGDGPADGGGSPHPQGDATANRGDDCRWHSRPGSRRTGHAEGVAGEPCWYRGGS
ncbi:MAG TPA: hypothetical protein VG675_24275 [Bryobacteraceae bacterium]|nr:hypothetical protein [Bryobacteraceae bacterium]